MINTNTNRKKQKYRERNKYKLKEIEIHGEKVKNACRRLAWLSVLLLTSPPPPLRCTGQIQNGQKINRDRNRNTSTIKRKKNDFCLVINSQLHRHQMHWSNTNEKNRENQKTIDNQEKIKTGRLYCYHEPDAQVNSRSFRKDKSQ